MCGGRTTRDGESVDDAGSIMPLRSFFFLILEIDGVLHELVHWEIIPGQISSWPMVQKPELQLSIAALFITIGSSAEWRLARLYPRLLGNPNSSAPFRRSPARANSCTATRVPSRLARPTHWEKQSRNVMSYVRVGSRAGTTVPRGAVCELPSPHRAIQRSGSGGVGQRNRVESRHNLKFEFVDNPEGRD